MSYLSQRREPPKLAICIIIDCLRLITELNTKLVHTPDANDNRTGAVTVPIYSVAI